MLKKSELQKTNFTKVAQSYERDCNDLRIYFQNPLARFPFPGTSTTFRRVSGSERLGECIS